MPAYLPDTPEIRADRAKYYNAIEVMDGQIGAKLKELEDAGLAEDTIVFYYSDNGGVLPRSKRYCYDDGLRCAHGRRVPAEVGAPGAREDGDGDRAHRSACWTSRRRCCRCSALPKAPHMQGSAFLGPRAGTPRTYAFGMRNRMDERYDFVRAATDGRFHYIRNYTPHRVFQHGAFEWLAKGYQSWERE